MMKQYSRWNRYTRSTVASNESKSSYGLPLDRWTSPYWIDQWSWKFHIRCKQSVAELLTYSIAPYPKDTFAN
jgi:hypothetical protein